MLALGALRMDAEALLGRHVDVVTVASLHPLLRGRVLSEARALGGYRPFVARSTARLFKPSHLDIEVTGANIKATAHVIEQTPRA